MGILTSIAGFAAGIYLSWRQPTFASRGLLVANGAIGVFYWLTVLTSGDGVENSAWLWTGCFLIGFALGNVARYGQIDDRKGSGTHSLADAESEEDRPKTHPVLPLQAAFLVPLYWSASLAWWWFYQSRDQPLPSAADDMNAGSVLGRSVSAVEPVWFGESDRSLAIWSLAAICGLLVAYRFRRLSSPKEWSGFFTSCGIKAYHPAIVFAVLFCAFLLAGIPASYFTRVKMDQRQVVWPQRKAYVSWQSHQFAWEEISDISCYETKTGQSKYGTVDGTRLCFRMKDSKETTISLRRDKWSEALAELKVRAKHHGVDFIRE